MKKRLMAFVLAAVTAAPMVGRGSSSSNAKTSATGTPAKPEEATTKSDSDSSSAAAEPRYKEGELKLGTATVMTGDRAWAQMDQYMVDQLKERSGGIIEATVFPGGQLGNDEGTIDGTCTGALDIVIGSTQNVVPFVNQSQILSLAYLFSDCDASKSILTPDGEVFNYVQRMYDDNGLGLIPLGLSGRGQRGLHTSKPIELIVDLENLKIRATSPATEAMAWEALGTIPTPVSFNDIYFTIQSNMVATSECTLAAFDTSALYEVANYHTKTVHQFTPTHITMGELSYNKLPEEYQQLIREVAIETSELGTKIADEADDTLPDKLVADHGLIVCEPDMAEFEEIVGRLYPQIAPGYSGQGFLDLVNELIK